MAISIHFSGMIKEKELLPLLVDEVKDIADENGWRSYVFDREFPDASAKGEGINSRPYGICFTPTGCEPVWLNFFTSKKLIGFPAFLLYLKNLEQNRTVITGGVSVKTQDAGPEVHKQLILLLDYISKKYLINFELTDEAHYWETRDEKILKEKFDFMTGVLSKTGDAFLEMPRNEGESVEDYVKRVANNVNRKEEK